MTGKHLPHRLIAGAAAVGALALLAVPSAAQPRPAFEVQLGMSAPGANQACFYARDGYEGPVFCANAGEQAAWLPSEWDNEISAIRVGAGVTVELCRDRNFNDCLTWSSDDSDLRARFNDDTSSFRVLWEAGYAPVPTYPAYPPGMVIVPRG